MPKKKDTPELPHDCREYFYAPTPDVSLEFRRNSYFNKVEQEVRIRGLEKQIDWLINDAFVKASLIVELRQALAKKSKRTHRSKEQPHA